MSGSGDRIRAYAAQKKSGELAPFDYAPGPLGDEEVEIAVEYCGICHSDLSVLDSEWGDTPYPFVGGHEAVGTIVAMGAQAKGRKIGQRVGLGWTSASCMHCAQCMAGRHRLCPESRGTIIGRHGGFAERVRAHWAWALPLPDGVDAKSAGPLFCGGLTVFSPLVEFDVKPTDRVAVIGIGGLGHLALKFANAWGCEVTAFTTSPGKHDEARALGAHNVVDARDAKALRALARRFDFVLVTVNVPQDWIALLAALAPRGRLHVVGAVMEPMSIPVFSLMGGQKSVSASPTGSPAVAASMLDFCARHAIAPQIEVFPMSRINDAVKHLRDGKARYRVVVENDFR